MEVRTTFLRSMHFLLLSVPCPSQLLRLSGRAWGYMSRQLLPVAKSCFVGTTGLSCLKNCFFQPCSVPCRSCCLTVDTDTDTDTDIGLAGTCPSKRCCL